MSQLCFICSKLLIASETVVVDRGMNTLIDTNVKRSDGFYEYLKDLKSVTIHVVSRKKYSRKSTVVAFKRQQDIDQVSTSENSPPRTRAHVSESLYCLKKCCLFCCDETNEEAEKKKAKKVRRKIHKVATLEFKELILKVAWSRSDEEAKKVTAHIEYEFDLVAAEAKYHNTCYNSFLRQTNGCKIGRPQDESTNVAMEEIFKNIENSDDCQFSIEELKNVISKWVYGMHAMNTVCEGLEDLADIKTYTTDQHVDASDSRIKKDDKDIEKLQQWFLSHDPFPKIKEIISIASGIVGDNKINCHKASEVGIAAMSKMTGETFNIKLKRADKVLPLLTMSSTIKVHDKKVPVDPVLLFQRMSISKTFEDEIEKFFEYELAPYPLSMFDETGMRKTQKSAIYNCFESMEIEIDNTNASYIIDGGYLLHRVVWDREATFNVTFDKYIQYVHKHFSHRVSIRHAIGKICPPFLIKKGCKKA